MNVTNTVSDDLKIEGPSEPGHIFIYVEDYDEVFLERVGSLVI